MTTTEKDKDEEACTHPLTDRGSTITTLAKAVTGTRSDCSLILWREIKYLMTMTPYATSFYCVVFFLTCFNS